MSSSPLPGAHEPTGYCGPIPADCVSVLRNSTRPMDAAEESADQPTEDRQQCTEPIADSVTYYYPYAAIEIRRVIYHHMRLVPLTAM